MPGIHIDFTGDNSSIASSINDTLQRMRVFGDTMKQIGQTGIDFSTTEKQLEALKDELSSTENTLSDYQQKMEELSEAMRDAVLAGDTDSVEKIGTEMTELAGRTQEAAEKADILRAAYMELGPEIDHSSESVKHFESVSGNMEKLAELVDELSTDGIDFSNLDTAAEQLREVLRGATNEIVAYRAQLDELHERQREAVLAGDPAQVAQYGEQIGVVTTQLEQLTNDAQRVSDVLGLMKMNLDPSSLTGFASEVNEAQMQIREAQLTLESLAQADSSIDLTTARGQISALTDAINDNKRDVAEYEKTLEELQDAQQKAFQSGDFSQADELSAQIIKVADAVQKLRDENEKYESVLQTVQEGVKKTTDAHVTQEGIMEKLLGGQKQYAAIISQLPGPLRAAVTGLNGMVGAAKAFIATPLGAVLAALILAYKALDTWLHRSAEGQQALAKISGFLSGAMAALTQVAMDVGKALYNAFANPKQAIKELWQTFKNDLLNRMKGAVGVFVGFGKIIDDAFHGRFKEAKEDAKELGNNFQKIFTGRDVEQIKAGAQAIGERLDGIRRIANAESDLNVRRNKLHRQQTAWMTEEAEFDKQIAEQRNKMRIGSSDERQKAAVRMQELINQKYAKQIEMAKEEYEIKKASNALTDSSQEDLDEEQRLLANITRLEAGRETAKGMALRIEDSMSRSMMKTQEQLYKLEEKRESLRKAFGEENESAEEVVAQLKIRAMQDGFKKEQAELDYEHEQRVAQIRKQYQQTLDEIEKIQKEEYQRTHGTLKGFVFNPNDTEAREALKVANEKLGNEERQYEIEQAEFEKRMQEQRLENRWAYLQTYGTYKEKELAITEKFDNLIKKSLEADPEDEYAVASLMKQRSEALYDLQKQYSSTFALIYADADMLSNNLLEQAIEATQEEIKKATQSGDIQKLTELYARLKDQLDVQSDRNRDWGFKGIIEGFKQLSEARNKQQYSQLWSNFESDDIIDFQELAAKNFQEGLEEEQKALQAIKNAVGEVSNAFSELGRMMEEVGGTVGEIGTAMVGLASHADDIYNAFSKTPDKAQAISTAISGTIELAGMVVKSIQANKKAQEEWNRTIEESQHKLAMLRLEALDYKQQNIFGVENPYKKAIDGATQYAAAMEELNKLTSELYKGQVQIGTKKAIDWGNVGKGAGTGVAVGASLGSIIPGLGTAIGAAIGGAIGLISGALSTKVVPVFENLRKQYGELFNPDTYELNDRLIADYDKLDDSTKQIVDNWDEIVAKAREAEQEMRDNFSNLAGNIGSQLSDALVNAFRNGDLYTAIDDFHQKMTDTIEDILEQLVFSATFGAMFDELEDRMAKSFGAGGDQDIVDDLIWMEEEYQKKLEQYNGAMNDVKKSLNNLGYEVFKSEAEGVEQRVAKTKSALGASQDSVDESNARLTTIQAFTYEINENVKKIAMLASLGAGDMLPTPGALSGIEANYGSEIAAIRETLALQLQQSAMFSEALALMQSQFDGLLSSSRAIEGNTARGVEVSGKIKNGLDTAIDRGVKML